MMFFSDFAQAPLVSPVYVCAALIVVTFLSFRSSIQSTLYRLRYVLTALAAWSYITSAPIFSNWLIGTLERDANLALTPKLKTGSHQNLIVALASGRVRETVQGNQPFLDEHGWNRTVAAIDLWKQIGGRIMFNGGPIAKNGKAVADKMAEAAIHQGVPQASIIVIREARNTYENISTLRDFVEADQATLWLVTSAIHMPRAARVAMAMNIEIRHYPCDFRENTAMGWPAWLPHHNGPKDFELALHELFGIVAYKYRGWI